MVPIHLDALYIPKDTELSVIEPMIDLTRLPYFDGKQDVNPNVANISEEIVSQPFQDRGFQLKSGVHLHWSLPDALTNGSSPKNQQEQQNQDKNDKKDQFSFPLVPNRWLVTRINSGEVKQWEIESDYLYPPRSSEKASEQANAIVYPYQDQTSSQPFRYMGKSEPKDESMDDWVKSDKVGSEDSQYLEKLTAVGYGEPSFAAFYPNCHSIFGFYDDAPPQNLNNVHYYVIGKYSNIENDCVHQIFQGDTKIDELKESLKEAYKWTVTDDKDFKGNLNITRTIFYACITFNPQDPSTDSFTPEKEVEIAVGNTGTEALSAYLAHKLKESDSGLQITCSQLEDLLEALHLADSLEGRKLDIGFKFKEARHEKGFTAVSGGKIWTIRPGSDNSDVKAENNNSDGTNPDDDSQTEIQLPEELAHLLNELNILQQACDRDDDEIESMRKQLFADWYKYMLCAYPPEGSRDDYPNVDEVKFFIEKYDLSPLQARITHNETLKSRRDAFVQQLNYCLELENAKLRTAQEQKNQKKTVYTLQSIPAPRYWLPKEPVILIADPTVKQTPRHGEDGRLDKDGLLGCQILRLDEQDTLRKKIDALKPGSNEEKIGFSTWTEQPWNPFLLEWEVEVWPIQNKYQDLSANDYPLTRNYNSKTITNNYQLAEDGIDLRLEDGQKTVQGVNVYSGRSILTPHAQIQLQQQIDKFQRKASVRDYHQENQVPENQRTYDDVIEVIERLIAGQSKFDENFPALAQSLGGFNEALLMHKQTLQLPISDPLGFEDYQKFTNDVSQAIQGSNRVAPQPHNDFNPIRTGILNILQLRLVDTFGRVQTLKPKNQIIIADTLTDPVKSNQISLPPRLVQPARINFRWLSAEDGFVQESNQSQVNKNVGEPEMNSHPATTVICGWLLPNNLDSSLMVYDAQGAALGAINQDCQWIPAPGRIAVALWQISNQHLRKLINYIINQGAGFLADFLTTVDNALDNIDPENAAQHQAMALLMGRPVAVVRAKLNLELQGLPALDQEWNIFRQEVETEAQRTDDESQENMERETQNFTQVQFPIRIGEYRQLNDGLVGYFIEEESGYQDDKFYAPQGKIDRKNLGQKYEDQKIVTNGNVNILQSIASPAQTLTMLVDPRGNVHATSGILPTKFIHIPPDQFVNALRKIEVTFLTAPILSDRASINLPLPQEPGFTWSWLGKENGEWDHVTPIGAVNDQATFTSQQQIQEGWLKLTQNSQE